MCLKNTGQAAILIHISVMLSSFQAGHFYVCLKYEHTIYIQLLDVL